MFPAILQTDLVSIVSIQVGLWLFGTLLIYFFFRYSQHGTVTSEHNPMDLLLAAFSAEPYDILSGSDYSFW